MSAIKKPLLIIITLAVVIALGFTLFASKIDGLIAKEIETQGSRALGTAVKVAKVETDLANGTAVFSGFSIADPERFGAGNAIEVATFSASVDYASRTVKEITIEQPIVNIKLIGGRSNFQELSENLSEDGDSSDPTTEENEITIEVFRLSDAQVNLLAQGMGIEQQGFVMDDMVINNLSGTSDQIANKISLRLISHVSKQLKKHLGKQFKKRALDSLEEKAGEVSNKLRDKLRDRFKPPRPTEEP
ncbi:MAG: hypothetical protein ACI9SX_001429 [Pseudoalteromonas tetraodonis]